MYRLSSVLVKAIYTLSLVVAISTAAKSQNIVPNPGFELKSGCPSALGGLNLVQDWFSPINTSPDYFNRCSTIPATSGIPLNTPGYQISKDGDAYVGIVGYTYNTPYFAEYVTSKLTDTLIAGLNYEISFNVSLANNNNYRIFGIDRLGAHLSKEIPTSSLSNIALPYSIRNNSGNVLSDTSGWTLISGKYKAKGGEEYITIGCFDDATTVDTQHVTDIIAPEFCYYYVDVVSVSLACDTIIKTQTVYACSDAPFNVNLSVVQPSYIENGFWNTGQNDTFITATNVGTYWHSSTIGCYTLVDSFKVVDFKDRIFDSIDTTVCESDLDKVELSSEPDAISYIWSTGSKESTIRITESGKYMCKAIKDCILYSEEFNVFSKNYIDKADLGQDQRYCKNEHKQIKIGRQHDSTVTNYLWNTGDTSCCITVTEPGSYILTLSNECAQSSDTIAVDFTSDCNDCLFIPTAFSPNIDGLNDRYTPIPKCLLGSYNIKIFNRWGQLLFQSSDIKNVWDGTYKSQNVELGTYYYLIEYKTDISESIYRLKGNLTLIR